MIADCSYMYKSNTLLSPALCCGEVYKSTGRASSGEQQLIARVIGKAISSQSGAPRVGVTRRLGCAARARCCKDRGETFDRRAAEATRQHRSAGSRTCWASWACLHQTYARVTWRQTTMCLSCLYNTDRSYRRASYDYCWGKRSRRNHPTISTYQYMYWSYARWLDRIVLIRDDKRPFRVYL